MVFILRTGLLALLLLVGAIDLLLRSPGPIRRKPLVPLRSRRGGEDLCHVAIALEVRRAKNQRTWRRFLKVWKFVIWV